ncbi:MAG TPA: HEAT repeat domain-containing protein [Polyangia bacterium]|nr:HEAT repeat domain-containing protein [Polyangia bacterium]
MIAGAGAACHRAPPPSPPPPPPPPLGAVGVQLMLPTEDASSPRLDEARIAGAIRQHLLSTGLFSLSADAGAAPVARAAAQIGVDAVEVGAKGAVRAQVHLRLDDGRTSAPDPLSFELDGRGSENYAVPMPRRKGAAPVTPSARDAAAQGLVVRIADDLIDGYVARRQIAQGPPAAVHAALAADGGELRDEAIRAVGERKLRDEAPRLLKLLNDPEERTRDAALGALIALGDRRAVSELTRTRSLRDRREMRKIIEAISILGGEEADQYLSFVAATHDDDEIRAEAAAARARLERRETDATALGSR